MRAFSSVDVSARVLLIGLSTTPFVTRGGQRSARQSCRGHRPALKAQDYPSAESFSRSCSAAT
jgi:hypothetical protein